MGMIHDYKLAKREKKKPDWRDMSSRRKQAHHALEVLYSVPT